MGLPLLKWVCKATGSAKLSSRTRLIATYVGVQRYNTHNLRLRWGSPGRSVKEDAKNREANHKAELARLTEQHLAQQQAADRQVGALKEEVAQATAAQEETESKYFAEITEKEALVEALTQNLAALSEQLQAKQLEVCGSQPINAHRIVQKRQQAGAWLAACSCECTRMLVLSFLQARK